MANSHAGHTTDATDNSGLRPSCLSSIEWRKMNTPEKNPWLSFSDREESEDCITGNEEGLRLLRDTIDRALTTKKEDITLQSSGIRGVLVVESDPRDAPSKKLTLLDYVKAGLSLLFIIVVLALGYGLIRSVWTWIHSWFK